MFIFAIQRILKDPLQLTELLSDDEKRIDNERRKVTLNTASKTKNIDKTHRLWIIHNKLSISKLTFAQQMVTFRTVKDDLSQHESLAFTSIWISIRKTEAKLW